MHVAPRRHALALEQRMAGVEVEQRLLLLVLVELVDDLFEDVMALLGHVQNPPALINDCLSEMTHVSEHIRKIYYENGDFLFKYSGKS